MADAVHASGQVLRFNPLSKMTEINMAPTSQFSRRTFLASTAVGLVTPFAAPAFLSAKSPNETVRLASVGVGGKGWTDSTAAAGHARMIAYCDVETGTIQRRGGLAAAAAEWPQATGYTDWRRMLDAERNNIDALTVSTPDHMHAPITMTALQMGIAVYTQKPLTRTVHEARALAQAAERAGVSTQMGNQHHSGAGYRTLARIIQAGTIGKVQQAHAWSNRPIWPQGIDRPGGADPVPDGLNWNHWLGVAPHRPFKKEVYHPFKWRGWYDFGAGALGDMGCHIIDPVVWALELGPARGVSYEGPTPNAETFPAWEVLRYTFPGTKQTAGDQFQLTWWDGGKRPTIDGSHLTSADELPTQGVMFIGEHGTLVCAHGKSPNLYPLDKFRDFSVPHAEKLDHYGVWVDGIRTGQVPNSSFAYAGPLTETVLLGVIASRVGPGELLWDSANLRFTNSDVANRYVQQDYRDGWHVAGLG